MYFCDTLDLDCVVFQMIGRTEKSVHASMCSMRKESLKKMELVLNSDRERVKKLNFIPINWIWTFVWSLKHVECSSKLTTQYTAPYNDSTWPQVPKGARSHHIPSRVLQQHAMINSSNWDEFGVWMCSLIWIDGAFKVEWTHHLGAGSDETVQSSLKEAINLGVSLTKTTHFGRIK